MSNQIKLASDIIREIRNGVLLDEFSDVLNKVTTAVEEVGKSGSITLKIDIKPGKGGVLFVDGKVTDKTPEFDKESTIFWASPEGNLVRKDPNQREIEGLQVVPEQEKKEPILVSEKHKTSQSSRGE